ncbi:hypothetical protein CYMTET_8053, partial [Cymbomonas tetramitiformis]
FASRAHNTALGQAQKNQSERQPNSQQPGQDEGRVSKLQIPDSPRSPRRNTTASVSGSWDSSPSSRIHRAASTVTIATKVNRKRTTSFGRTDP